MLRPFVLVILSKQMVRTAYAVQGLVSIATARSLKRAGERSGVSLEQRVWRPDYLLVKPRKRQTPEAVLITQVAHAQS